ncbi:hypothetical protein [Sphingomonas sp.]|uniref:hypothetical protein n=1 Tax=Sphingomonas sp. TaxID=28214 RepID=UPI002EDA9297
MPLASRNPDGGQDGARALESQLGLYDVAGSFRHDLIALRCKVRASQKMALPSWCPLAREVQ